MELRDYLRILRKGWPLILTFVAVGLAAGALLTSLTTKEYEASVQVFVATSASNDAAQLQAGNTFTEDRVQSYTAIANSPAVTGPVAAALGKGVTSRQLQTKITADAPQNKVLINLHVVDQNPVTAARIANLVAAQFGNVVEKRFEQTANNGKSVVKITVVHPATTPSAPIKPNKVLNIGLGFVLGLLVGAGVVILRDVLDNTVNGPEDFEVLGVPVLGLIPFDKRTPKAPIAFRTDPHSSRSEAYRQLRTNMQFVNIDHPAKIIAVTSAIPGEGKTTTALNLAASLAEAGFRVCLIEADLRRPTLAASLGLVGEVGLTTALIGKSPVEAVLQNAGRNLAVLTSGPIPPNPSELLITDHAAQLIRHIAEQVDYTIIDTAPLLPVTDGAEIAARADATLIVHHAGKSTKDQAARSLEALDKVGVRPVGVILNMITKSRGAYDYNYGYYYTYRPDRSRAKRDNDRTESPRGVNGHEPARNGTANGHSPTVAPQPATTPSGSDTSPLTETGPLVLDDPK